MNPETTAWYLMQQNNINREIMDSPVTGYVVAQWSDFPWWLQMFFILFIAVFAVGMFWVAIND